MPRGVSSEDFCCAREVMCRKHVAGKSSSSILPRSRGVRVHGRANAPSGRGVFCFAMARGVLLEDFCCARETMCPHGCAECLSFDGRGVFLLCHGARRFVGEFPSRPRGDVPKACRGKIVEFNSVPPMRCAPARPRKRPVRGTGVFYCAMARGALLGNSRPARAAMCRKHVAGKSSSSIPSRPCGVRPYGCANAPSGWRGTFRWRVFVAPARRCLPR